MRPLKPHEFLSPREVVITLAVWDVVECVCLPIVAALAAAGALVVWVVSGAIEYTLRLYDTAKGIRVRILTENSKETP